MQDPWKTSVTPGEVYAFLEKHKKRGARVLSILGKDRPFYHAVSSEIGQELLKDLMVMADERLSKIAKIEATDADKAEYKVLWDLLGTWIDRIASYNKRIGIIKQEGGNNGN